MQLSIAKKESNIPSLIQDKVHVDLLPIRMQLSLAKKRSHINDITCLIQDKVHVRIANYDFEGKEIHE